MDTLKILLILGLTTMVIAAISVVVFAWANPGSRNLALATGTLVAATILFIIQLSFELRGSESTEFISTEFTIDRLKPIIGPWEYHLGAGQRFSSELEASDWLANNNPDLFAADREKLTNDLAVFSLVSYLAKNQFDWQLKTVSFSGQFVGTFKFLQRVSKPNECTTLTEEDLRKRLSEADNAFAEAPLRLVEVGGSVCLPPKTNLTLTRTKLSFQNPFSAVSFDFELAPTVIYGKPRTRQNPLLQSGEQQFETRLIGIHVKIKHFRLRRQHRDSSSYRDWSSRLVKGAQTWFSGPQQEVELR